MKIGEVIRYKFNVVVSSARKILFLVNSLFTRKSENHIAKLVN